MIKDRKFIKILSLIFLLSFSFFYNTFAQSGDGINVNLHVGDCNNNSICEPVFGEDIYNCPIDCTPIIPPTPNPTPINRNNGRPTNTYFNNLNIEVGYNNVIIKWKSSVPSSFNIKWGTSNDYKDGAIKNVNFLLDHKVEISNLQDNTLYYFTIQAEDLLGGSDFLNDQVFHTLALPDTTPPSNPSNVKAISTVLGIVLSWTNPRDEDFDYIRIMRNTDRFYGSPDIGRLAYEGSGVYFTDANVKLGTKYFYSLFSRDKAGNYSSGSLVSILHNLKIEKTESTKIIPKEKNTSKTKQEINTEIYVVSQGSSSYDFNDGDTFALSGDEVINIKTNYITKTKDDDTWVEIKNFNKEIVGQYLFKRIVNSDGFVYTQVPIFEYGGLYQVSMLRYINSVPTVVKSGFFQISKTTQYNNKKVGGWGLFCWLFLLLILLIILYLIYLLSRYLKRFGRKN